MSSSLDDIDGIWTTAMLRICRFEPSGEKQGASCLFTAVNAVEEIVEEIKDNLGYTGASPESRPQLNKYRGRYRHN